MQSFEVHGLPPESHIPQILAIGKFDGVHIGHQSILDEARYLVAKSGARLSVMSFEPHPAYVLTGNEAYLQMLTPRAEKLRILAQHGVDAYYAVEFNEVFKSMEPEEFVRSYLVRLQVQHVVVGRDFRFGRNSAGDTETLKRFAAMCNMTVHVVSPIADQGAKVSSSQIRSHLAQGRVESATALLGRPYTMTGTVVHGDKRGRQIGFPTANIGDIEAYVMPKGGVYAVSVIVATDDGSSIHGFGVLNAGTRPTVAGTDFRLEVHLLGFAGDLYGKTCRVSFLHRIRDERKFHGLDELKAQINQDCETVGKLLGQEM